MKPATNPRRFKLGSPRADNADEFEGTALLAEEVVAVVKQVSERYPVYGVMVQFLAYTGLRAGELAGLNVGDLSLVRADGRVTGAVRVARTRRKCRGGWQVDTPKSRASRRTVPLDNWLADVMANYLDETHPRGTDPEAPLFPHRKPGRAQTGGVAERQARLDRDQPIEPSSFYRNVFQPAVRAAGLPRTRLHDLRHTFATMRLRAGPPDHYMQVSVWMGHADYAVTLKHYAHVIKRPDGTKAHQVGPPPRVVAVELPVPRRSRASPAPTGEARARVISLADLRTRRRG